MKYIFTSFGYRCSSAGILKRLNLKTESRPFDWVISRIPVIRHCLETDFCHFLDPSPDAYRFAATITHHYVPYGETRVCDETILYNVYYHENLPLAPHHTSTPLIAPRDTYAFSLAMNHHNIQDTECFAYFGRCVDRLNKYLTEPYLDKTKIGKMYLYIHPALTEQEYTTYKTLLLGDLCDFQQFIQTKYLDTYPKGLCIIPVKTECPYPITNTYPQPLVKIHNTLESADEPQCIVYALYTNRDFIDAGEIFMRNAYIETDLIVELVKQLAYYSP